MNRRDLLKAALSAVGPAGAAPVDKWRRSNPDLTVYVPQKPEDFDAENQHIRIVPPGSGLLKSSLPIGKSRYSLLYLRALRHPTSGRATPPCPADESPSRRYSCCRNTRLVRFSGATIGKPQLASPAFFGIARRRTIDAPTFGVIIGMPARLFRSSALQRRPGRSRAGQRFAN
jgi:hypothetical protein